MAKESTFFDKLFLGGFSLFAIALSITWIAIPGAKELSGFHIASYALADGIFVGWADELAIKIFHSDNTFQAKEAFKYVTLFGQQYHPGTYAIFILIGTFFSIGGVIAVWIARSAIGFENFNMSVLDLTARLTINQTQKIAHWRGWSLL